MHEDPAKSTGIEQSPEWALVLQKLLESLTTLSGWVESVNSHLAQLEARLPGSGKKNEFELLQEELDVVLDEISRVKAGATDLQTTQFHKSLGQLRMRQAKILLRLGSKAPGASPNADDDLFGLLH